MRFIAHVLCVSGWLLLAAAPSFAQPSAEERAQQLFFAGVAHGRAGRWEEAVTAFEQSRQLVERPSVLQNLAVALRKTKRPVRAFELVRGYLRRTQSEPPSRARSELTKLASELAAELALLELHVEPQTAEIELDGEHIARNEGVLTLVREAGSHTVRVAADGHREYVLEWVAVAGASTREDVRLAPLVTPTPAPPAPVAAALRLDEQPTPVSLARPRGTRFRRWAFGLVALGVALEAAGTALSLTARERSQCEGDECTLALRHEVRRMDWIANVSWAAGGASLVTGGVLLWSSQRDRSRALHVTPVARGLGARLSF